MIGSFENKSRRQILWEVDQSEKKRKPQRSIRFRLKLPVILRNNL